MDLILRLHIIVAAILFEEVLLAKEMKATTNKWLEDGHMLLEKNLNEKIINKKAKGVILFVGDGMGISTITSARIFDGQLKGMTGEENVLSWEKYGYSAFSKTYCHDRMTTDSSASATAFLTGVKTNSGVVSLNENVKEYDCSSEKENKVKSIIMLAEEHGLSTGIVTTTRVTHATPGSAYAHAASRDNEDSAPKGCKDIASQLIEFPYGDGIEVVLGGGQSMFYPNTSAIGQRTDGRNLTKEWADISSNHKFVSTKSQLMELDPKSDEKVLGLFTPKHLSYSHHRQNSSIEPTLIEMVNFAVKKLQKNPKGYFLLVEAGRIDHGHHGNRPYHALYDTIELHQAVEHVDTLANPDETLTIVTADHSHVFTIGGYQPRGAPLFNYTTKIGKDGKKMTTLGYYNGPGAAVNTERKVPSFEELADTDVYWKSSFIPLNSETHGAEDVGIFAQGCQAHLFRGVVENTYIYQVMDYALCLTPEKKKMCRDQGLLQKQSDHNSSISLQHSTALLIILTFILFVTN